MIAFKQMSLLEKIKRLWPPYRERRDAEMRDAIRYLMDRPGEPCMIDGEVVRSAPNRSICATCGYANGAHDWRCGTNMVIPGVTTLKKPGR